MNGFRTHELFDAGVVLFPLNDQANWEMVILWAHNTVNTHELKT